MVHKNWKFSIKVQRVNCLFLYSLLRLFVLGLSEIKYEQFVNKRKEWFGLEALDISVQSVLLEFLFDYLLLPYRLVHSVFVKF